MKSTVTILKNQRQGWISSVAPVASTVLAQENEIERAKPPGRLQSLFIPLAALVLISVLAYTPNFIVEPDQQLPTLGKSPAVIGPIVPFRLLPLPNNLNWDSITPPPMLRILLHAEGIFATTARGHRAAGLTVHILSALLLWQILRRLSIPGGWLAAAMFAVHPAGVAAVDRLDQHGRLWATALSLASILFLLKVFDYLRANSPGEVTAFEQWHFHRPTRGYRLRAGASMTFHCTGAFALAWCAALCQPTIGLGIAPIGLILLLWWQRFSNRNLWKPIAVLAPLFLLTLSILIAGFAPGDTPARAAVLAGGNHSPLSRALSLTGWSVRWIVMPFSMDGQTGLTEMLFGAWLVTLGIVLIVGCAKARSSQRKWFAGIGVGLFCFLLLLPTVYSPIASHTANNLRAPGEEGEAYVIAIPVLILLASMLAGTTVTLRFRRSAETKTTGAIVTSPKSSGPNGTTSGPLAGVNVTPVQPKRANPPWAQPTWANVNWANTSIGGIFLIILSLMTTAEADHFASPERSLQNALAAHPNATAIRARLAQYFLNNGEAEQAVPVLAGQNPSTCTDVSLALAEGDLLRFEQRPGAAVVWYLQAKNCDPLNAEALDRLATTDLQVGRTDDATELFKRAITAHPADAQLRNDYGLFLAALHELNASHEQFQAAVLAEPDFVPAHVNFASVLVEQGRLAKAAEQLKKVIELDPENFEAFHNAGVVLVQLHDFKSAVQMLTAAAQMRPDYAEGHNDLGVALSKSHRYNQAIREFNRAIELRPTYTDAARNLAVTTEDAAAARP